MYVSSMHILSTHGHVHGLVHPINIYLSTIPFHHRATLYTYPIADNFPHWKLCNDKQIYTHAHVHTHLQDPNSTHLWNFMNMLPVDIKVQKFVLRFCFRVSTCTLYLVLCCNLLLHFASSCICYGIATVQRASLEPSPHASTLQLLPYVGPLQVCTEPVWDGLQGEQEWLPASPLHCYCVCQYGMSGQAVIQQERYHYSGNYK